MGTRERVVVNGVEVDPTHGIAAAVASARPSSPYVVVRDGQAVAAVMWDGETRYDAAGDLVPEDEWKGSPPPPPVDPPEVVERRTAEERARVLRRQLAGDLEVVDTATLAQLRTIVRRLIRAERASLALALAETSGEPADRE